MTYDGRMIATLLLLTACTEETDKRTDTDTGGYVPTDTGGDSAPPVVEATPYLGLAAATTPGSLASTCQLHVDVFKSADGEVVATADLAAQGRDWSGVAIPAGVQLKATATATGCTARADPSPFTSGTFSGEDGLFVVFWYTSVNLGYDNLEEGSESGDFVPGVVRVRFVEGTTPEAVQAAAAGLGTTAVDQGDGSWALSLSDARRPIGEVLTAASALDSVREAAPVWVTEPTWW
jgi:hypothetical protein